MRRIKSSFAIALLAASLFFTSSNFLPAFADPVTIKGQRLAEISDIVKTVTSSDFPELQKHSVLLYERLTNDDANEPVKFQPRIFTINADGSLRKQFDFDSYGLNWTPLTPRSNVIQMMNVAISQKRFGMRRNVIYSTAGLTDSYFSIYGLGTIESSGTEDTAQIDYGGWDGDSLRTENRNIWANASLTVKGIESKDVFVVAHTTKMDTTGNLYFKFFTVSRKESGWIEGSSDMSDLRVDGDYDEALGWKVWDFSNGIRNVDITAGDFDGDGYKNEILMAWSDNGGIYTYIYQVSAQVSTDGTVKLNVKQMLNDSVYRNSDWGIEYLDQASVQAIAGDFDGDRVQEAVTVTKTSRSVEWLGIKAKVYKYSNGGWTNSESTTHGILSGTLKATRVDLNGDGQDEIIVLAINDQDGDNEQRIIYPCLVLCRFDRGSITPIWNEDQYYKGGLGVDYWFVDNGYNDYYKGDEDFSMTAGPLTGATGQAKLAEDIVISHVNSDASRVFVIPTKLDANRNFAGFGDTQKIYENTNPDSIRRGGLITADFANETLMLDKPTHTQDAHDESYVAVIQALPYHVDNVAADGSLTSDPINYTFSGFGDTDDGKMRISYKTSSSSSESNSVSFGLASTTETVSILGDAGKFAAGYLKFRATEANIAGNFDPKIKAVAGAYDAIMKFVTDKIDKTTSETSSYARTTSVDNGLDARQFDRVVTYVAPQHIWRYKILNNPLPSWYVLGHKIDYVSKDFNAESKAHYITFSMYDEPTPSTLDSLHSASYNPRHEEGNFFSYPSEIEDIEGYKAGSPLTDTPYSAAWVKSDTSKGISFKQSSINALSIDQHIQKSELTKTISAVAAFFGAKDPSPLPPYTSHSETFVKQYSTSETINIDVYGRTTLKGEQASHTLKAMPYITHEGTMKVGTAVELFNAGNPDSPALWRDKTIREQDKSRYARYPDPALVLPFKYIMRGATLLAADQVNASRVRGVRFYVPSLDLDSNNDLLGGLEYKISVPIYNASFVNTGDFEVSLSYAAQSEFDIEHPASKSNKLHHIQTVTMSLEGWQNTSTKNKGWAEFTWNISQDLSQGDGRYYFYIQVDPNHKKTEVHESRVSSEGKVVDVGGNNEGYFVFNYSSPGTLSAKQNAQANGTFNAASHSGNGTIFRTKYKSDKSSDGNDEIKPAATIYDTTGQVSIHAKFDGTEYVEIVELLAFLEDLTATDSRDYIPIECELEYTGNEYYHEAYFYGVNYKPGTSDKVSNIYLVEKLPLVPGKTVKFMIRIRPGEIDWVNGSGFVLVVPELTVSSNGGDDDNTETVQGVSSSGGGCGTLTGSLLTMVFAGAVIFRRAKRK